MMLIDKVRAVTHSLHQELDNLLIPYIENIQTKDDYAALLLRFYGFFKPVYDSMDACINTNDLPDYAMRRKPEWILNDLQDLKINETKPLCKHLPVIANSAAVFGALYVLEGSTLGGVVIKKIISERLHTDEGLSFFTGYGRQTRERWNVFIRSLNNMNINKEAEEVIIQTAAATFVLFKDWLQQSGLNF